MFYLYYFILFIVSISYLKTYNSTLVYYAIGNITDTSLTIKAKTSGEKLTLILGSLTFPEVSPDSDNYCTIQANGLSANTTYPISFKLNNDVLINLNGTVRTLINPLGPTFFSFVVTSNSKKDSTKLLYDKITKINPSILLFLGNINDDNICSTNWKDYETVYLKS